MKKIATITIVFLVVSSMFSILTLAVKADGDPTTFYDDFEAYSVGSFPSSDGWELVWNGKGTGYQVVTDAVSHSPSKSLQLWGQSGWSANVQRKFTSTSAIIGYEAYLRADSNTGTGHNIISVCLWNKAGLAWGKRFADTWFGQDGQIYTRAVSESPFIPLGLTYEANRWYKVRVIIDRGVETYDVWIDDNLAILDVGIWDTGEIDAIMLQSGHAGVRGYFDDVKVFDAIQSGPVGYWKFDEGAGTSASDSSGNGNTGSLIGGPQWVDGVKGKAVKFDGISDYMTAADSPSLDVSGNQITIEFWMRPTSDIDASTPYQKLYDKGDAYHSAIGAGGIMRFSIAYVHDLRTARATWSGETWYHIAHVYDGSQISIYVDGVLDNSEPETGNIHVTGLPFTIAAYTFGGQWFFPGAIDEFAIYDYARTTAEIWDDYNSAVVSLPWKDDFNYASKDEMKSAGWELGEEVRISVGNGVVTLDNDGVSGCGIKYAGRFPSGVNDFVVEAESRLVGRDYCGRTLNVWTQRHRYCWFGDGYYPEYCFIRYSDGWGGNDEKVLRFPGYAPVFNEWSTFSLEKRDNTFYMYENGILKNTYTETDSAPDELVAVGINSGWIATMEYDYISVASLTQPDFEISVTPNSQSVQAGDLATYEVSLSPMGGFNSEVALDLSEYPSGVSYSFSPEQIMPGETSLLEITTSLSTSLTTSPVVMIGESNGVSRSKQIDLRCTLYLEIEISRFHTTSDLTKPFFNIVLGGRTLRFPKEGAELALAEAYVEYPGPLYIPLFLSQPSFPLEIEVKMLYINSQGNEAEVGTAILNLLNPEVLPTTSEFNLPNVYMKLRIRPVMTERIPKPYIPDGITEEHTPWLNNEWYWFMVGADTVWNDFTESDFEETVVAVLDTGVDYNHPALDDVIWLNQGETGLDAFGNDKRTNWLDDDGNGYVDDWHGYDFVFLGDSDPMDEGVIGDTETTFHGTGVAGAIAAQAQTGFTAGVATAMRGNLKIMPVRVLNTRSTWDFQPHKHIDIAEGIEYAMKNGADIITLSLGQQGDFPSSVVLDAIEEAVKQNILVIGAIGNDESMAPFYPAAYDSVMSVSGVRVVESYVGFWSEPEGGSNFGPRTKFDKGVSAEVCAPSSSVWTTTHGPDVTLLDGTSLAAPIVTATAALIKGYAARTYQCDLNPSEVRFIIRESATDLGHKGWDPYYGYGMVNASAALEKVDELLSKKHWHIKLDPPANLDLHAFDVLGRHVGLNYTTGEMELEVPEAFHTGDEDGGFESIFIPFDMIEISVVGTEVNQSIPYTLDVTLADEDGTVIGEWHFEGTMTQGETRRFTSILTETGDPLIISWEYTFRDVRRGTMLKISTDDKFFQFVAPDKTFSVKYDPDMFVRRNVIIICFEDEELKLLTVAIDTRWDICLAWAQDVQTGKTYWLIDRPAVRGGYGRLAILV